MSLLQYDAQRQGRLEWKGWIFTAIGEDVDKLDPKSKEDELAKIDEYIAEEIFACTAKELRDNKPNMNAFMLEGYTRMCAIKEEQTTKALLSAVAKWLTTATERQREEEVK